MPKLKPKEHSPKQLEADLRKTGLLTVPRQKRRWWQGEMFSVGFFVFKYVLFPFVFLKTILAMNSSSQSMHTRMHQQFDLSTQSRIASLRAAMHALDSTRALQKQPFAYPPEEEEVARAIPTNFALQVGVQTPKNVLTSGIRASITSLDESFAVMCFPTQHGSFLWELSLPRGNYKLEVRGTNVGGSLTTADIQGAFSQQPEQTHSSSDDSDYTLSLDFTIE